MLIWLKAGAWREGVSALFKAIRMELQSLQPQDSSTIKWNKTPSGMTAHVVDTPVGAGGAKRIAPTEEAVGSGDASYNGYFKIVDVSDDDGPKVQVVDGFGWDGAGVALINDVQYTIATTTISITANSYIYLIADDVGSTPTFETFTSKQNYELGQSKTLIGRIKGKTVEGVFSITEISQEQHGAVIGFIDGDCDEEVVEE